MRDARHPIVRLGIVTVLVGIGGGISGGIVSYGLHLLEHLAYGYREGDFLVGASEADPWRRLVALAAAGVVGGVGYWAMRRWLAPVVSIEKSVAGRRMPAATTLVNVLLQIVTVGLGASIGREVAPRELAAFLAGRLSEKTGLTTRQQSVLIACAAGSGLAAVYNVPLAGAVFALEVLLGELTLATAVPAFVTSGIATLVARVVVPGVAIYDVRDLRYSTSALVFGLLVGPLMGLAAVGFVRLARWGGRIRPSSWGVLIVMPLVFTGVGAIGMIEPSVLGNGKALGELVFAGGAGALAALVLAVLKTATTGGTIAAGAAGGTLTPSLVIGASLGAALGGAWSLAWPGTPLPVFAVIAGAAFLSSSMRAPATALLLTLEFTGQGTALLLPTVLAVAGAAAVTHAIGRYRVQGVP